MRSTPIVPARIHWDGERTPRSADYDDLYHPRGGALAQARHVFLSGNGLPGRWRGRDAFVVLETGFGLGNNFLALWRTFRDDTGRPRRLHVIAIDAQPPTPEMLAATPREEVLREQALALAAAWPPLVFGLHRLRFDDGAVELLLAFGDVATWLPQIVASVDAFFLDGFAPAKNPQMWEPRLFKAMARLAAADATAATWSAARAVRDGLQAAGFDVRSAPGSGGKRDVTTATFAPRHAARAPPRRRPGVARSARIVIVGAGLAGSAVARELALHGYACTIVERADGVAAGASGNAATIFHGTVHGHDGRHARWHRAAALLATKAVDDLVRSRGGDFGSTRGLLRLASMGSDEWARMHATALALGLPRGYAEPLGTDDASRIAGVRLDRPGWFFAGGGWVDAGALTRHLIEAAGAFAELRTGVEVAAIVRDGDRWRLNGSGGRHLDTADVVVCANACDAGVLLGAAALDWPIARVRGQASAIDIATLAQALPALPITGSGYAIPAGDGRLWFGATAQEKDVDAGVRLADHRQNWQRVRELLPAFAAIDPGFAAGRTAFRCTSADRLPLIGAVPDVSPAVGERSARPEQPRFSPRCDGLYVLTALGSRGVASSSLGSAIVAAQIAGAPQPVEADLLDAVDPARFESRRVRRR